MNSGCATGIAGTYKYSNINFIVCKSCHLYQKDLLYIINRLILKAWKYLTFK